MARNETALVAQIVKAVLKEHPEALIWKIHGDYYQENGIPDLVMCIQGRFFGIEVKNEGPTESEQHARDRATPGQLVQIARIKRAGGVAGVALSAEEVLAMISEGLEKEQ